MVRFSMYEIDLSIHINIILSSTYFKHAGENKTGIIFEVFVLAKKIYFFAKLKKNIFFWFYVGMKIKLQFE